MTFQIVVAFSLCGIVIGLVAVVMELSEIKTALRTIARFTERPR